jgi:pyrroline-5-carboxylate reductase
VPVEEHMDAVTAVSGSGPAYVFYFMEALQEAAFELGLDHEQARRFSLETFVGAARLAQDSGEDPALLRAQVTSRGGTTERALSCMESEQLKRKFIDAVRQAAVRSRELGEQLGQ